MTQPKMNDSKLETMEFSQHFLPPPPRLIQPLLVGWSSISHCHFTMECTWKKYVKQWGSKVNDILLQGASPVCKPHSVSLCIDISWYFYHKPQPSHKPTLGHVSRSKCWDLDANGVRLSQLGQLGDLQPQPLDVPRGLRSQGSSKH